MDPKVIFTLPQISALAVGVSGEKLVVATTTSINSDITLHCMQQDGQGAEEATVLRGHYEPITLLSFSTSTSPALLCSVSSEAVLLWNIGECLRSTGLESASCSKQLHCVSSLRGVVNHAAFSEDVQLLALCKGQEVIVCNIQSCEIDTTLVGHSAAVTCSCFSPHLQHRTIITASEDRTFKVWDLEDSCLLYQSAVVSASPFLCLSVSQELPVMVTGSVDGVLRVYDLSEGGAYQCLLKCDISKETEKMESKKTGTTEDDVGGATISSKASWRSVSGHVTETTPTVETGPTILAVCHCTPPPTKNMNSDPSIHTTCTSSVEHMREVLQSPSTLVVVTHTHLLLFNSTTLELLDCLDLRDPLPPNGVIPSITTVAEMTFHPQNNERCHCSLVGMLSSAATVLSVNCSAGTLASHEDGLSETGSLNTISVLSSVPLVPNSPLKAEFTAKEPQKKKTIQPSRGVGARKPLGSVSLDKPLTFKNKVKSSGYTDAPRMKAFTPKTNTTKTSSKRQTTKPPLQQREYPVEGDHPTHLLHSVQLTDRPSAINSSCFSGCGQHLTCACSDKNAYAVRVPLSSGKTHAFVGHNESVLSASWSHGGEWMISSSKDRTARVWAFSQKDPLLCMDKTLHNSKEATDSKTNKPFKGDVSWAQFYYLDKFILLTSGNSLYLYKYQLDTSKPDDIKRYQSHTRYKLVTSLSMESAQSITAASAVNDFHSYIVLVAGSNKSVDVFDMNVAQCLRTHADVHSRPPHCLQQNKGSRFVSHPSTAYDLYLTAAVTDGIKLWDLRANRCVSRFTSHRNQALSVSATFSPCGRFIATGSEDKCAYVYDLRLSSPLHKFKGHSDTVSTVAYHPLTPMLATGSLNGTVRIFTTS